VADNLKAAAYAAGLSEAERKKIEDLNKVLNVHRQLNHQTKARLAWFCLELYWWCFTKRS